jgi:hypothetical protein
VTQGSAPLQAACLQSLGAARNTIATGELYLSRELQQWKLGPPHALDLNSGHAMQSMETVYDDGGYFL